MKKQLRKKLEKLASKENMKRVSTEDLFKVLSKGGLLNLKRHQVDLLEGDFDENTVVNSEAALAVENLIAGSCKDISIKKAYVFPLLGGRSRTLVAVVYKYGKSGRPSLYFETGCFNGSDTEFLEAVIETHCREYGSESIPKVLQEALLRDSLEDDRRNKTKYGFLQKVIFAINQGTRYHHFHYLVYSQIVLELRSKHLK